MTDLSLRERLMRNRPRQYGAAVEGFIRELEGWLSDKGLALVPVDSTPQMYAKGASVHSGAGPDDVYDAMVKAAPPAADLLRGKTNDQG